MRALVHAADDEELYVGYMNLIKKFAKKCKQSNLLQQEIVKEQLYDHLKENAVLKMIKHNGTRYISELKVIHRFCKILIYCLSALSNRIEHISDAKTRFELRSMYISFTDIHALKF